jgi:hypothetical protein
MPGTEVEAREARVPAEPEVVMSQASVDERVGKRHLSAAPVVVLSMVTSTLPQKPERSAPV